MDSQSFPLGERVKAFLTSHSFEMRKLFFSCLRSEEGVCEAFGFYPPVGSYLLPVFLRRPAPFTPFAPEPECSVHLIPTSGATVSVLTLMQSQPLNLPFHQKLACYTCPGHMLRPSTEQR